MQLRPHHLPQIGLIHSGIAQCVVEPCASSNGSPLHNSCFAPHRNRNDTQHEDLPAFSAFARASAPTRIPCLIWPGLPRRLSLQPSTGSSSRYFSTPFHSQSGTSYPTQTVPVPSAPPQTHSKYIAFHEGGFLQVAVSEAPLQDHAPAHCCVAGRSRYSTKTYRDLFEM